MDRKPEPQSQQPSHAWTPEAKPTWSGDNGNSDWSPNNDWKPEQGREEEQWRDETKGKDCRQGVFTYTDKDGINAKVRSDARHSTTCV